MLTLAKSVQPSGLLTTFLMILAVSLTGCATGPHPLAHCTNDFCVSEFWFNASVADAKRALGDGSGVNRFVNGAPPLYWVAVRNPNPKVAKLLLDRGAIIDLCGENCTPLSGALSLNENPAMSELLLREGADTSPLGELGGTLGYTTLHWAAYNDNPEIIELVLDRGHVDSLSSDWSTPVSIAVRNDNLQTAKLLVESGADVHIATAYFYNLLHFAAERAGVEMVSWLVHIGVNSSALNLNDETPCDVALRALKGQEDGYARISEIIAHEEHSPSIDPEYLDGAKIAEESSRQSVISRRMVAKILCT